MERSSCESTWLTFSCFRNSENSKENPGPQRQHQGQEHRWTPDNGIPTSKPRRICSLESWCGCVEMEGCWYGWRFASERVGNFIRFIDFEVTRPHYRQDLRCQFPAFLHFSLLLAPTSSKTPKNTMPDLAYSPLTKETWRLLVFVRCFFGAEPKFRLVSLFFDGSSCSDEVQFLLGCISCIYTFPFIRA